MTDVDIPRITQPTLEGLLDYFEAMKRYGGVNVIEPIHLYTGSTTNKGAELLKTGPVTDKTINFLKWYDCLDSPLSSLFYEKNIMNHFSYDEKFLIDNLYQGTKEAFDAFANGGVIDPNGVDADIISIIEHFDLDRLTLTKLHTLKVCAPTVYTSAIQASILSIKIVKDLGYDLAMIKNAGKAGIFANVCLPDDCNLGELISLERIKLTDEQKLRMQKHIESSVDYLEKKDEALDLIMAIQYHHERLDGSGYPDGLKSRSIPFLAQVLGLVESYVSMTTRAYHEKRDIALIVSDLHKESGVKYDPALIGLLTTYHKDGKHLAGLSPEQKIGIARNYLFFRDSLLFEKEKLESLVKNKKGYNAMPGFIQKVHNLSNISTNLKLSYAEKFIDMYIAIPKLLYDINNKLIDVSGFFNLFSMSVNYSALKEDITLFKLYGGINDKLSQIIKCSLDLRLGLSKQFSDTGTKCDDFTRFQEGLYLEQTGLSDMYAHIISLNDDVIEFMQKAVLNMPSNAKNYLLGISRGSFELYDIVTS